MGKQNIISSERLNELKERSKRCVCKYCGGRLKIRLIDFGKIETANMEIFCEECNRIEYGTEPEIYQNAVYLVDNLGFNMYENWPDTQFTRKFNIAKVCEIIAWHENQIGLLDENGYKVPIYVDYERLDCADGSVIKTGNKIEK